MRISLWRTAFIFVFFSLIQTSFLAVPFLHERVYFLQTLTVRVQSLGSQFKQSFLLDSSCWVGPRPFLLYPITNVALKWILKISRIQQKLLGYKFEFKNTIKNSSITKSFEDIQIPHFQISWQCFKMTIKKPNSTKFYQRLNHFNPEGLSLITLLHCWKSMRFSNFLLLKKSFDFVMPLLVFKKQASSFGYNLPSLSVWFSSLDITTLVSFFFP